MDRKRLSAHDEAEQKGLYRWFARSQHLLTPLSIDLATAVIYSGAVCDGIPQNKTFWLAHM